jgi:hypothetical protein
MVNQRNKDTGLETVGVERPALHAWVGVIGGMASFGVVAFNDEAWELWQRRVPWLPRWTYQAGFSAAVAEHIRKAIRAHSLATQAGMEAGPWTRQTLLLGFPSLRLLERAIAVDAAAATVGP